ncbi:MAG: endonuclease/exonuclease/phosphatase family protein [Hyphomicrobiales bacterium]
MIFRFLVLCGLVFPTLFMLLGIAGRWIRPLDSFAHFFHYYLLAFAFVAIAAFILKMKKTVFVTALTAGIGVFLIGPAQPFSFGIAKASSGSPAEELKILTFNVLYLNTRVEEITDYVNSEDPDVIFLQEVSPENEALLDTLKAYPYQQRCRLNQFMSIMVLSKTKGSAQDCLPESRLAWMELEHNGQKFRAVSTHLHWPWPFGQWFQIDSMRNDIAVWDAKMPIILGGDFNAVPWSHAVRTVEDIIRSKVVPGFRMTLYKFVTPVEAPLFMPIDQILLPEGTKPTTAKVGPNLGSDHRPVSVSLVFDN